MTDLEKAIAEWDAIVVLLAEIESLVEISMDTGSGWESVDSHLAQINQMFHEFFTAYQPLSGELETRVSQDGGSVISRFESLFKQIQKKRAEVQSDFGALSKGQKGVAAYKKVL